MFQQLDLSRSSRECCQQPKYFVNNHATLTIENIREGSFVIRQLVALGFVEFKVSRCAARVCCDRHFYSRWLIILSLQTAISNSIYSNVYLKVKQVCREAIYRDRLMLLPSYPLYLWKVSHTSTVDVESNSAISSRTNCCFAFKCGRPILANFRQNRHNCHYFRTF